MNRESDLPLFKTLEASDSWALPQPNDIQNVLEDYAATSLSLHKHPIQLLKEAGALSHYTPANELINKAHKSLVSVAGLVICRQSPGTAAGGTFLALEDETGTSNVIVWLATARSQKQAYLQSKILNVKGILERGDTGVTHIISGKLQDLSHLMDELNNPSRDFY